MKENTFVLTKTPLAGYNLTNIFYLLAQARFMVDCRYIPRLLYLTTLSSTMAPFRIAERIKFDKIIRNTEIKYDPIFILGHWRSGTTYLHNVLFLDKNLGFFSTFQAYLPGVFLVGKKLFKPVVATSIPKKRPMDDVVMEVDLPQEDEYAIAAFSPYSCYHGPCFPRNSEFYNKFVCMEDVPKKTIEEWKEVYLYLLKKVTLCRDGKRLVLKNPVNTARIKLLLEMFPDAKFIHIYRNPYHIYQSMMRFLMIIAPLFCVQKPPKIEDVEKLMMDLYIEMFEKYFKERGYIPEGNLVEVRYEDFIQHPLKGLKRIYTELHLDGFKESEKAFSEYIASQANVKIHRYEVNEELREKVYKKWGFAFKEFGYES